MCRILCIDITHQDAQDMTADMALSNIETALKMTVAFRHGRSLWTSACRCDMTSDITQHMT